MTTLPSQDISSLVHPRDIIVATDLTDGKHLLPYAIAQAKSVGARVTLVHVLQTPDEVILGQTPAPKTNDVAEGAAFELHRMAEEIRRHGVDCAVTLKTGIPEDIVREEITRMGATRLLLGTHSHRHAGQGIIGTIANSLLRSVSIPTLVIGPHVPVDFPHGVPHSILHPVSLRGRYRQSAAFTLSLARALGADLTLAHILNSSVRRGAYVQEQFDEAEIQLESLIDQSAMLVAIEVDAGETVAKILELSRRISADWIVIGIEHDLPWWSMRNTTTYKLIAESTCPVFVFRSEAVAADSSIAMGQSDRACLAHQGYCS